MRGDISYRPSSTNFKFIYEQKDGFVISKAPLFLFTGCLKGRNSTFLLVTGLLCAVLSLLLLFIFWI